MKDRGSRRTLSDDASSEDIKRLLHEGATIIDTRPLDDDEQGHVMGSLIIPTPRSLKSPVSMPKDKPVVTCNADDALSTTAAGVLVARGFKTVDGCGCGNVARPLEKQ